jgi:hypothetical protein
MVFARTRERLSTLIVCPDCGQTGVVLWKAADGPRGARRKILLLSSGFAESFPCAPAGDPQIVCDLCDGSIEV